MEIPEDAFVFCTFNNSYKISAREFRIWMNLLDDINNSYFLFLTDSDKMKNNILSEAKKRNVDSKKIKFLDFIKPEDHLARHSLADLFLDSFNYNAHTSAVDSLWAELPILTMSGKSFSSRICGSILMSLGIDELVTFSEDEYNKKAIYFAKNRNALNKIKNKIILAKNSEDFSSKKYTEILEEAYINAHKIRVEKSRIESFEL